MADVTPAYEADFPESRILLRFTTLPEDNVTGVDDVATEYVILECPEAIAGLIVYGKISRGEWIANWGGRHVIKRLLEWIVRIHQQHNEPCRLDHHGFCQAHYCSAPCVYGQTREAMK